MFVQRHPPRSSYHHHQHHCSQHQAATNSSGRLKPPHPRRRSKAPTPATPVKLVPGAATSTVEKQPNKVESNLKVSRRSFGWRASQVVNLNGIKLKHSESLPSLHISLLNLQESKKRLSCDWVLLSILKRHIPLQSTGDNRFSKTKSSSLDSSVKQETSSFKDKANNTGFISNSLKNIWSFSYFWLDFLIYQVETWRLIAEHTLPLKNRITNKQKVELGCHATASLDENFSSPLNHSGAKITGNTPDPLMSYNDYYLVPCDGQRFQRLPMGAEETFVENRLRSRSRMAARNPLYRNLSLNVEEAEPHSYYTTVYYQQPQRPHSSRAEYPTSSSSKLSSATTFNYQQRLYNQHFSADSITNNSHLHQPEQFYTSQLARPPSMAFHNSNHLIVAASRNSGTGCGQANTQLTSTGKPAHKTFHRPLTTIPLSEHHSSALNSFDYSTGGDDAAHSLPITKLELCRPHRPTTVADNTYYQRRSRHYTYRNQMHLQQHHQSTHGQYSERSTSSMSYHRTYSEATDSRNFTRHSIETVGGPRIGSDSDLATNRSTNAHNKSHEKVKASYSSGANYNTTSQTPTELIRSKSPQQTSGVRKTNSSSLKLSLAGARKRLGFKQSGSTALVVQRSEEILPSEPTSFLSHQSNNYSPSSSSETTQSGFFIEGLGPGQIVSRQGLVSPYLGDIQITLTDRRGMLEVEVVRARRLQMKAGAGSLPAPYVKIYLMKDKKCIAKWKTSTIVRTLDPLYQELFIFREDYADCILQIIVWGYYGKKDKKSLMGVAQIHLNDIDISNLVIGWYKLFNAPSMTNSLHSSKNLRKMLTKNLTIAN